VSDLIAFQFHQQHHLMALDGVPSYSMMTDVNMLLVQYRGGAPAVADLLGGHHPGEDLPVFHSYWHPRLWLRIGIIGRMGTLPDND
jgi:hypothetical protein